MPFNLPLIFIFHNCMASLMSLRPVCVCVGDVNTLLSLRTLILSSFLLFSSYSNFRPLTSPLWNQAQSKWN